MIGSPTTNKEDCHLVGTQESSDILGEQLHNCNPMKYECATCLPHKDGGVPLSALPKDTTSKLADLFFTLFPFYAERQEGKL